MDVSTAVHSCNSLQRIREVNIKYFCSPGPKPDVLNSESDALCDMELQWEKAEKLYCRSLINVYIIFGFFLDKYCYILVSGVLLLNEKNLIRL